MLLITFVHKKNQMDLKKKTRTLRDLNHEGIEFVGEFQRNKFDDLFKREFGNQGFMECCYLHQLNVWNGVLTVF